MTLIPVRPVCGHCGITIISGHAAVEHPGLCCDCFDLSFGMPLDILNDERWVKGLPPIERPWPGLRASGDPTIRQRISWWAVRLWRRITYAISEAVGYRRW